MQSLKAILKRSFTVVLTSAALAAPALAADPNVRVTVTAVPAIASFSRAAADGTEAITTNSAYRVRVVNDSTNTLNNVRIHGEAEFTNGIAPEYRASFYVGVPGATCTDGTGVSAITGNPVTMVDCLIGQLRGGGGPSPYIVVIFKTPTAPVSPLTCTDTGVSIPAGCDRIVFNWTAFYGEGSSDSGGASHNDFTPGVTRTALGTETPTTVNTFALGTFGEFFYTGGKRSATPTDPWVTLFTVPLAVEAIVIETDTFQSCTGILSCWISKMDVTDLTGIKAFFPTCSATNLAGCLKVVLRRDATTLAPGAKIADWVIRYSPTGDLSPTSTDAIDLKACGTVETTGDHAGKTWPFLDHPCYGPRTAYPKNGTTKNPVEPGFEGDWGIDIYATDNGSFRG